MAKVLIWLASGDKSKLQPGITYGRNATKRGWVEDVKFVVFGESERLLATDEELFQALQETGETAYCKFVSDQLGVSESLTAKGARVIYVGEYISNLIKEGYQVLTF